MKQFTLKDFENLPWRQYRKEGHQCIYCTNRANNIGYSLCNTHTDIYRKLSNEYKTKLREEWRQKVGIDHSKLSDLEIDGINHVDYPDYCDAFISGGLHDGIELTDDQLEYLNEDMDLIQEVLYKQLY